MAYNNYYQGSYQPMYNAFPQQPSVTPVQQPAQIQNGGFISVDSKEYAFNYPVAPGATVFFRDENAPFIYVKTMTYSPANPVIFETYRRLDGDVQVRQDSTATDLKSELDELREEVRSLKHEIDKRKSFDKKRSENNV